jgi:hypothetical protein
MAESSNYTAILAQIVTDLESITDVGNVFDRERRVADWKKFYELFKHPMGSYISGWTVNRIAVSEEYLTNCEAVCKHDFRLTGIWQLNDADDTETLFQTHIEAVRDLFRAGYDLNGTCELHQPLTNVTIDHWMYGSVLCHRAVGHLIVQERLLGGS